MRSRSRRIAVILPVLLSACAASPQSQPFASAVLAVDAAEASEAPVPESCAIAARDDNGTVAAAFESTIGAIQDLPAVADNPQLAGHSDDEVATVCYIDSDIPKGPPRPASGTPYPSFDRAVLVVVGTETFFVSAGYRDRLPIRAP